MQTFFGFPDRFCSTPLKSTNIPRSLFLSSANLLRIFHQESQNPPPKSGLVTMLQWGNSEGKAINLNITCLQSEITKTKSRSRKSFHLMGRGGSRPQGRAAEQGPTAHILSWLHTSRQGTNKQITMEATYLKTRKVLSIHTLKRNLGLSLRTAEVW